MLTTSPKQNTLRAAITHAYHMNEAACLQPLLAAAYFSPDQLKAIQKRALMLAASTRDYKKKAGHLDELLHQYDLSTEEGIALMCLAEALLRIPDKNTVDKLISDKLSGAAWGNHLDKKHSLFVNAATWSLLLTGKIYSPTLTNEKNLWQALKRSASRLGAGIIRPLILRMMKAMGNQFVIGEDITSALKNAAPLETMGYAFSYDMLGEAARTKEDADHYYQTYLDAIEAVGKQATSDFPERNAGISIKLSALHPRYEFAKRERVLKELPPQLLTLALLAKKYRIGLTIDAEEADRLDLSLDIFELIYTDPSLSDWNGLGLAVQAYQKRASAVLDWLLALSKQQKKRIMVRLVKGAYWDAEIKYAQVNGFSDYPVFTRKNATDVAYLACAKKLLSHVDAFYPQFGTHNAYTVAAILEMTDANTPFEFQCLYGMGRALYDAIVNTHARHRACRMYAPVGSHKELLGYLVRRLLENGANSSFVNRLSDDNVSLEQLVADPVARIEQLPANQKSHPRIPLPKHIYGEWLNASGIDLSDVTAWTALETRLTQAMNQQWFASSLINGRSIAHHPESVRSPIDSSPIGEVARAEVADVELALQIAADAQYAWGTTPVDERAAILEKAADLFQQQMPELVALLIREGGKCIPDSIAEIRETIDYCRYYAYRARLDLKPIDLPGPTGEANQLTLHPRGVIACISPWNFPLAIFTGQIVAALVTGNGVIAKPAEQTPLIAFKAIQILHQAGIPKTILHLLIGRGSVVGAKIVSDSRIAGVMFTGSTETAKFIEQTLANRPGPSAFLVAETGGQNAMIVDSSALPEQAVIDIAQSAFNSAGQRCSALRVLFVQHDIAPTLLKMLKGYMAELTIGNPVLLSTDIGPVIDNDAKTMLEQHVHDMNQQATLLATVPLPATTTGSYFAPCAFELTDLKLLKGEVFGPILHIIRYAENELDQVMDAIIATGFGLTLGIHSRIDSTIERITKRMPVGNTYVNRNMIGAVVGVQPFGGERLSGTGPKAGGPHYLPRLCVERTISINTAAVGGNARLISLLDEDYA